MKEADHIKPDEHCVRLARETLDAWQKDWLEVAKSRNWEKGVEILRQQLTAASLVYAKILAAHLSASAADKVDAVAALIDVLPSISQQLRQNTVAYIEAGPDVHRMGRKEVDAVINNFVEKNS